MDRVQTTAAEALRSLTVSGLYRDISIQQALPEFLADKGFSPGVVIELSQNGSFASIMHNLMLRGRGLYDSSLFGYFGNALRHQQGQPGRFTAYTAEPKQNIGIDRILSAASTGIRSTFIGEGAASAMSFPDLGIPSHYRNATIAIVGYGPAGIMVHRMLTNYGFRNVTTFEQREVYGIWSQANVARGTRNNPRNVSFGDAELSAAPGGGDEIPRFLSRLKFDNDSRKSVEVIAPGDLKHALTVKGAKGQQEFAIVINACGIGKPVPISDPERMLGPDERVPAGRWQIPNMTEEEVAGSMYVFVGLGNSTAEMISQIHRFQDRGVDVDYRIVTHYPKDAVHNPSQSVESDGKVFRVFRDLNRPQLTSYQGDLEQARADYYRALFNDRIISGVKKWDAKDGKAAFWNSTSKRARSVELSAKKTKIFVLGGYRHSPETFAAMGCTYDSAMRCALHDYDGEFVRTPGVTGGERVYKGYFGLGAVLNAPHNRNSTVIPGMIHRLPDLLFGIIMRAGEWAHRERSKQ